MEFGLFKKEWLNEMVTNNGDSVLNLTFENPVLLVFLIMDFYNNLVLHQKLNHDL